MSDPHGSLVPDRKDGLMVDICGDCGKVRVLVDGVVCVFCDASRRGEVLSEEEIYHDAFSALEASLSLSDPWGRV